MTYFYDDYISEKYGKNPGKYWPDGTYITPKGVLFDVDSYASIAHAGGFVIPFFMDFMNPEDFWYSKSEMLNNLIGWEEALRTKKYNVHPKEQEMRLCLVKYLINVYRSKYSVYDDENEYVDFSYVTGIPNGTENLYGRDRLLKDILVQACNYDSIESQLYRTITTSKINIYETFYDYILHDYKIYQIPKKIYDEKLEKYVDYVQPEWMISDKEKRLKDELASICKLIPIEERKQYCRSKVMVKRYDFLD